MERSFTFLIAVLLLVVQGAFAQAPLPLKVSTENANKFISAQPEYATFFAVNKEGATYCSDQLAYEALLSFERSNGLRSTLAATALDPNGIGTTKARLAELDREITALRAVMKEAANEDMTDRQALLDQLLLEQQKLQAAH